MKNLEIVMVTLYAINFEGINSFFGALAPVLIVLFYITNIKTQQVEKIYGGSWKAYIKGFFKTKKKKKK